MCSEYIDAYIGVLLPGAHLSPRQGGVEVKCGNPPGPRGGRPGEGLAGGAGVGARGLAGARYDSVAFLAPNVLSLMKWRGAARHDTTRHDTTGHEMP